MDDTKRTIKPLRAQRDPVVIGTGLVALDVVIPHGLKADPQLRAGGTCGNVLTALAYLGWQSYPIARLSNDGASKRVADDLRKWNVQLDFITFDNHGSTPVVIQHIRSTKTGAPTHTFSRKCPCCGAFLPWYKAVRVADVSDLVPKLPKPQVYFFDRTSSGAIALAREARELGAVVYFEPSTSSDPRQLKEALAVAHIVKVASDRITGNNAVLTSTQPAIVIETRGSKGLRFRHSASTTTKRQRKWHTLDSIPAKLLKDTAGAGDWCTAGIIHMIGAMGAKGINGLTLSDIHTALRAGQAMAAWACGFDGPRGGMYVSEKAAFQKSVHDILNGYDQSGSIALVSNVSSDQSHTFACEACRTKSNPRSHVLQSRDTPRGQKSIKGKS